MSRDLANEAFETPARDGAQGDRPALRELLISFERNIIVTALFAAEGNQKRAAAALGLLPTTLQEKLKRFGLINHRFGRPHPEADKTLLEDVHK